MLKHGGITVICSYIAHDNGEEDRQVYDYLANLDKKLYEISKTEMINRNLSPALYLIVKKEIIKCTM